MRLVEMAGFSLLFLHRLEVLRDIGEERVGDIVTLVREELGCEGMSAGGCLLSSLDGQRWHGYLQCILCIPG